MRILFVPSWYPRPGAKHSGTFFEEQALMLSRAGHEVEVLALETSPLGRRWQRDNPRVSVEHGIRIVRLHLPSMPRALGALEKQIHRSLIRRAAALFEERGKAQIVHAHTVFPGGVAGGILARRWGVPLVITEHRPSTLESRAFRSRSGVIGQALEQASLLTTVSQGFAQALFAHYPGTRWLPIELPVPDAFFNAERPVKKEEGPLRFAHVSHIDDNKRVIETCRAFLDAFKDSGKAILRIAGGSPEAIESVRAALPSPCPSIEFLGRLERADIVSLLADSEVFVLVSALEAGGTVFSEAQAAGARLIASATWAGCFAFEEGNGELVGVDDAPALVEAMRRICDPSQYATAEQIRERARERYSEQSFVSRWSELYGALVESRGLEDSREESSS